MNKLLILPILLLILASCTANKTMEIQIPSENGLQNNTEISTEDIEGTRSEERGTSENEETLNPEPRTQNKSNENTEVTKDSETETDGISRKITVTIPEKFTNDVDFSSQAPYADWEMPYKEACEEASLIMAVKYLQNKPLDQDIMKEEIDKLVAWEDQNLGQSVHTDVSEMMRIAKEYFNITVKSVKNPTVEQIKYEISKGNIVVAPFAGQYLGNPNYRDPGPVYHTLTIIGYDNKNFITNDPGTKNGKDFKYKYNVIMEAIHDYNSEDILKGEKVVLVLGGG